MNLFRFLGDMCHLAAILLLPYKLHTSRSAAGVSLKMQELYLLVFVTRYLDLFTSFYSMYNSMLKITYISVKAITIGMMRSRPSLKASYDRSLDRFRPLMHGVIPSLALTGVIAIWAPGLEFPGRIHHSPKLRNFLWAFSLVLEPLAVVPQLLVFRGCTDAGHLGWVYVCLMGAYRALYIPNWVYRAHTERFFRHNPLPYTAAAVQTALFVIFLVDRILRVSRHLPPDETGDIDIMGSNSSARERLLPDQNTDDHEHQHQHRETGFDGEIHDGTTNKGGKTISSAGGDGATTDAQTRDGGGSRKAPRRGRWRRQERGGEALNKIESVISLERGSGGAQDESSSPPSGSGGAGVVAAEQDFDGRQSTGDGGGGGAAATAADDDDAVGGGGDGGVYVV